MSPGFPYLLHSMFHDRHEDEMESSILMTGIGGKGDSK